MVQVPEFAAGAVLDVVGRPAPPFEAVEAVEAAVPPLEEVEPVAVPREDTGWDDPEQAAATRMPTVRAVSVQGKVSFRTRPSNTATAV